MTCKIISASRTTFRVDLNEATKCGGSLRMNPTVSLTIIFLSGAISNERVVESSVAKSLFSASTPAPVNKFINVDFPAFV